MKKLSEVCGKYGMVEKNFSDMILSSNFPSNIIDDELYVDENEFLEEFGFNTPIPNTNLKLSDLLYFDNIGLIDSDVKKMNEFIYVFNHYINQFGNDYTLYLLMKHSSVVSFILDNNKVLTTFIGFKGKYKEYVTHLIDGINKIDLSKIDITDVMNFELSDERKIFTTQKINVTDLKPNERCFSINEEDFINYLLHILPQYLPSDVNFHPSVIGIINDDEDDISVKFSDTLWEKSHKYLVGMKTNINSIDFSKIDVSKIRVS